jgi:hypothetical protein
MKKLFTLILLISFGLISGIEAQTPEDISKIVQKCIDLPALQNYLELDNLGNLKQLRINYWQPLLFPIDLPLVKEGKKVQFVPMSVQADKNGEAYLLFKRFITTSLTSNIVFDYHYGNNPNPETIEVRLEIKKEGDSWEISDSEISNK